MTKPLLLGHFNDHLIARYNLVMQPISQQLDELEWLYVITNPAMPGLVKVGYSRHHPSFRALGLETTGIARPFEVAYCRQVVRARSHESVCHLELASFHEGREWFRCPVEIAVTVIDRVCAQGVPVRERETLEISTQTQDNTLRVYAWTREGLLLAGYLLMDPMADPHPFMASFHYDQSYLKHPHAFPLDPFHLPLSNGVFRTLDVAIDLGAIYDIGPDSWGRKVILDSVAGPLPLHRFYRQALLRSEEGIGAIVCTGNWDVDLDQHVCAGYRRIPAFSSLAPVADAARKLEGGAELGVETRALLAGSWTIGGARPKAILRDDRPGAAPNSSVIAKFESRAAQVDGRNKLEWATLEMAADVGMPVPRHDLVDLGEHTALVLERFDRVPHAAGVDRRHYVSAASFVSAKPQSKFLDSAFDRAYFSWKGLLTATAAVSASASEGSI